MYKLLWRYEVISEPVRLRLDEYIELSVIAGSDLSVLKRDNVFFDFHIETLLDKKIHYLDSIFYALAEEDGRYIYYDAEQGKVVFTNSYYGKALEDDTWKKLLIIHVPPHPLYDAVLQAIKACDPEAKVEVSKVEV